MHKDTPSSSQLGVDLRALVMAGVAACPLFLWSLVDIAGWYASWATTAQVIFETAFEFIQLLFTSVGLVVVSLSSALCLRHGRAQPIALTTTSLAIVAPLVLIDATVLGLSMMQPDAPRADYASYYVVTEIIRYTANVSVVALAARLYSAWSGVGTDMLEARRCIALGAVVVVLATVSTLSWIWFMVKVVSEVPYSLPLAILQGVQYLLWSLVSAAGPVFLFGWIAICAVRRRQRETSIGALVLTGLCAALVYVLLIYGRAFGSAALQDPSLAWLASPSVDYNPLIGAAFAGVGGAILYGFAVDGAALAERLRALPSTITKLRNRPLYVSDEDVER